MEYYKKNQFVFVTHFEHHIFTYKIKVIIMKEKWLI